jgi:hypothetical protein
MTPQERRRHELAALQAVTTEQGEVAVSGRPYLDLVSARIRLKVMAVLALGVLAAAEVTVLTAGSAGAILYGVITLGFLLIGGRVASRRLRTLLWALTIVPTSRLIALGAPLDELTGVGRLAAVGILTLLATLLAIRSIGFGAADLGLQVRRPGWRQVLLTLLLPILGVGLGIAERAIVPSLPYPDVSAGEMLLVIGLLGLVDDLAYQGVLLEAARRATGQLAVPFVAAVVAVLHIGYGSWPLGLCAFVVALVFGCARTAGGSLVAVILGHLGLSAGLFLIGPEVAPSLTQYLVNIGLVR